MDKTEEITATLRRMDNDSFKKFDPAASEALQLCVDYFDGGQNDKEGMIDKLIDQIMDVVEIKHNWICTRYLMVLQRNGKKFDIPLKNRIQDHLN